MSIKWRRAFTLVELLIVLAIIGLLVSLLLPAVFQVRSVARKIQCANHHRQVALATLNYAASHDQNLARHFRILPYLEEQAVFDAMHEPAGAEPGYRVEDQFPDRGDRA